MSKHTLLFLTLLAFASTAAAVNCCENSNATSKTYFSVNPQYSNGRPEHLSMYRADRMVARQDGYGGAVQGVVFGGKSTKSEDLARYFLPFNKCSIVVAEGPDPLNTDDGAFIGGSGAFKQDAFDILAHNFNIRTTGNSFSSIISFAPKQSFVGGAFNYVQQISDNEEKGFWIDITVPVIRVSNSMNMCEKVTGTGVVVQGFQESMKKAMNQSDWRYGRISPCVLKKTGVADVEARIGYDSVRGQTCRYSGFLGVIIPTGNKPCGKYVFEPVVGRNRHWGIEWGSSFGFELWNNESSSITIALDTNNSYLFERKEIRSFDLVDKQWSRYINVFTDSSATTTTPGINVFTKSMKIKPRGSYQINSAFIFKHRAWGAEIGYNGFHRQSEEGCLSCKWQEGPAIAAPFAPGDSPLSMNLATMRMWDYGLIQPDANYNSLNIDPSNDTFVYKPLKERDLNLHSALHPTTIAHTIYGSIGHNCDDQDYPTFCGFGGSYQFSANNTSMSRWSVWGKVGVSI